VDVVTVFVPSCIDDVNVAMQVWDIGGQSIGGRMLDKYIYGSHVSTDFYTDSLTRLQLAVHSAMGHAVCR